MRLGVAAMIIGQFVMTLIMVITPLHMNHHAHGEQAISWVIMAHTLGMYGLSSLTSRLTDRFGPVKIIVVGALILGVSAVLTPISNQVSMLAFSLFLLGLGWNFCFIAGSALFFSGLLPFERGRAQGASEMMVALAAGAGSLGTGAVFAEAGIVAVSAMGLAFSLVLILTHRFGGCSRRNDKSVKRENHWFTIDAAVRNNDRCSLRFLNMSQNIMEGMMIGVLTHHWANEEQFDEARELLDRNGLAQSKAPGFISRVTLVSTTDPTKITSLVIWESNEIYDAWRASPERAAIMGGASVLWSQPTESERFEVVGTLEK